MATTKLQIFASGFKVEHKLSVPDTAFLRFINLSKLALPEELQIDQLCEHRLYFTDIPENTRSEYLWFITWRWNEKFSKQFNLIRMEQLDTLPLYDNVVHVAAKADDWTQTSIAHHVGMAKYLHEMAQYTGLQLFRPNGFWSNQFICSKRIYLEFQSFFRDVFQHFHKKYGFNYDYFVVDEHKNRKTGAFYERISSLFFSNRTDLIIKQI